MQYIFQRDILDTCSTKKKNLRYFIFGKTVEQLTTADTYVVYKMFRLTQ